MICSDQVIECNGKIREKPENEEEARQFLKSYGTYPAKAYCAVVVMNTKTGKKYKLPGQCKYNLIILRKNL